MSERSERVKLWRRRTKERLVEAFGDACCICSYARCVKALEFHHLDPSKKDFFYGEATANIRAWKHIVKEIRKCVLVCSNCHKEIHAGVTMVPENAHRFDECYAEYEKIVNRKKEYDKCPVCEGEKPIHFKTCSRKCSQSRQGHVDWSKYNVTKLLKQFKTYEEVGRRLNITGAAVRRKHKAVLKEKHMGL